MKYAYDKEKLHTDSDHVNSQKTEPLPVAGAENPDDSANRAEPYDPLRSTVPNGNQPALSRPAAPSQPSANSSNELITARFLKEPLDVEASSENTRETLRRLPVPQQPVRQTASPALPSVQPAAVEVETTPASQKPEESDELKLRQSERFEFLPDAGVRIRIAWKAGDDYREIYGDLVDISGTGLRFNSDDCVPVDRELDIAMMAPAPELYLTAVACWSRPETSGHWCTGCRLEVEFPVEVFSEMGARGQINRRRERRKPVSIPALVSFELDKAKEVQAEIIDISTGGMCIAMPGNYELGTRILVRVQSEKPVEPVPLIVRWNSPNGKDPVIGGSFLNRAGYEAFAVSLGEEAPEEPERAEARPESKGKLWRKALAGIVFAACIVATVVIFRDIGVQDTVEQRQASTRIVRASTPRKKPAATTTTQTKPQKPAVVRPRVAEKPAVPAADRFAPVDLALKRYASQQDVAVEYRLEPQDAGLLLFAPADNDVAMAPVAIVPGPPPERAIATDVPAEPQLTPDLPAEVQTAAPTLDEEQSVVVAVSPAPQRTVTIHNPPANRGAVTFIWGDNAVTLPAGAKVELPVAPQGAVRWDRGGKFGPARQELLPGRYEFSVSPQTGWLLHEA